MYLPDLIHPAEVLNLMARILSVFKRLEMDHIPDPMHPRATEAADTSRRAPHSRTRTQTVVLRRSVCGVRVSENHRVTGPIVRIPDRSQIHICGVSLEPGMLEIQWLDARYAVFAADLVERSIPAAVAVRKP